MVDLFIHPLADVHSENIGIGTRIWQFVVILPSARIGVSCNICAQCFIENDVIIGNRVTIKNGVQLWDGLRVGDDVFIGSNVTFTNDKFPRSKHHLEQPSTTTIESGASIGGGATILPGLKIGRNAMIGSGAVVTRSVPPNAMVLGNPARIVSYVDAHGDEVNERTLKSDAPKDRSSRVRGVTLYSLPSFSDIRGTITVGEFERGVPFAIKRYFMVFDVPSVETRGEHAHHKCHQFLICVRGKCSIVADDGRNREEFILDRPDAGLHMPPMIWGIQYKFSSDATLLVFASHYYDTDDYIRDYTEFRALVGVPV